MTASWLVLVVLAQGEPSPPPLPPPPPPPSAPAAGATGSLTAPPLPLPSPPPLVQAPEGQPPPPPRMAFPELPRRVREPEKPLRGAVHFTPMSLFALYAGAEYEHVAGGGFAAFATAGIGGFFQVGFETGARLYVSGAPLDGFFLDARGSLFALPSASWLLVGPGVTLGVTGRKGALVWSVGVGATMWFQAMRGTGRGPFGVPAEAQVFVMPGIFQPPDGQLGVQPTVRLTIGPGISES